MSDPAAKPAEPVPVAPPAAEAPPAVAAAPKLPLMAQLFTFVVGLVAVAAIAATAWVYVETQREIVRISTDIAQIRLSLELFGRQQANSQPATPEANSDALLDLSNRLAILEESWRSQLLNAPAIAAGAPAATTPTSGADADCIPQGTRFLVTAGDVYPICGTEGVVNVTTVDLGYVSFEDGTTIPAGGNAILRGTACTMAVVSSGADGMTGYAELRITC